MTKLFYTNPLHAAIMYQSFGVKLYIKVPKNKWRYYGTKDGTVDWLKTEASKGWIEVANVKGALYYLARVSPGKIYIRPDSHGIIAPHSGDLGIRANDYELAWYHDNGRWHAIDRREYLQRGESLKIIMRNNEPFYMPESKA